jgi:hypothetical protein
MRLRTESGMDAPDAVSGLWRQYTSTRDMDVRNRLVLQFQTYAVAQEMQIPVEATREAQMDAVKDLAERDRIIIAQAV